MADRDHTLRLRRAHQHLQELNGHVTEWRDGGHYDVRQKPDADRPGYTLVEAIAHQPPAEPFAVLIAECLGGMRSSLDLLAYELACRHTGLPLPPDIAEGSEFRSLETPIGRVKPASALACSGTTVVARFEA